MSLCSFQEVKFRVTHTLKAKLKKYGISLNTKRKASAFEFLFKICLNWHVLYISPVLFKLAYICVHFVCSQFSDDDDDMCVCVYTYYVYISHLSNPNCFPEILKIFPNVNLH